MTKAIRDLGHDPKISLDDGVRLTVEWMNCTYLPGNKEV